MINKGLAVLGIVAFLAVSGKAQDLIVKHDGETIKAYQVDVSNSAVFYRLEDSEDAPFFRVSKSNVLIVKMQNGKTIVMDKDDSQIVNDISDNSDNNYTPSFPSVPVADPEIIARAEIGSLIEFYDGTKGIVFYLDGGGHGLAVYLYAPKDLINWQKASTWRDCVDIDAIPNERRTDMQIGLGAVYCNAAITQIGLEDLPAIKWCKSIGPDWHLPSLGELYQLIVVANSSQSGSGDISRALIEADGNRILSSTFYFTSSEDDNTNVYSVGSTSGIGISKKYTRHSCRAVRMF